MAHQRQADRLHSSLLAAVLAVAGSLFFFDKLDDLLKNINFSWLSILHSAPALLVVVAIVLTLADRNVVPNPQDQQTGENGHE